jgi:NADH-quinone oxidoreductase subunit J
MTGILLALNEGGGFAWLVSPSMRLLWAAAVGAVGLWMMLSNVGATQRRLGAIVAGIGLVLLAATMPKLSALSTVSQWAEQVLFWLFAGVAVACSAAAITARSPVHTAVWFAGSLLGVAGLFLFQNAQFLGVATIVVYAGAIVVTFLFVLMLANPAGHARYDRISWSRSVVPLALLAGWGVVAMVARSFSAPPATGIGESSVLAEGHMVPFGTELFARHLVAVEVAGTILLVALVGAVAIVMHGKERREAAWGQIQSGRPGGRLRWSASSLVRGAELAQVGRRRAPTLRGRPVAKGNQAGTKRAIESRRR